MSRAKDLAKKNFLRTKRRKRVRGSISGCADMPRVTVFKSNRYLSAQAIDDIAGNTLAALCSSTMKLNATKENAVKVGAAFAEKLKEKNIESVVFDRNGYLYHGVIKAFADALRDNGIKL